ncbi:MAG: contractile injection system protein, VgrG/Pvc8 family [Succinivibrio sp.]
MQAFKSSIEAKFKNNSLNFIKNTNILGIELNEGISIPFILRLDFITDKRLNLKDLKDLVSEEITVDLKQISSDPLVLKSYSRILHGIVTAYEEHGLYNRGVGSSSKMYKYSLTIMPEIIKLANSGKQRSFTDSSVIDVIKSVLKEHEIDCDCETDGFWTNKPEFNTLVFTQSDESDLEFINKLCNDFGINYLVEYNKETNKNKVIFSRGYITGTDFADNTIPVKLNPASPSFFDEHTLEDIVSSGGMFDDTKADKNLQDYTYAFNFLLNDTDPEKKRKEIVEYCQKSQKALNDNLCAKTIIRANDLNYVPGAILSVPDYNDKSSYIVTRAHLKLYSLGEDPAESEFSLMQSVLCVTKNNSDILGAVNRISRISLDSRPSDINLALASEKKNAEISSTSDSGVVYCVGTVCDASGNTEITSDKKFVPAKGVMALFQPSSILKLMIMIIL